MTSPDNPASDDPLIGRSLGGRYYIESHLATGTFGAVYRARIADTPVAIKVLHPQLTDAESAEASRARFMREARVMAQMDSPYAVRLLDCGEEPDGTVFIVQELLTGRSLQALLDNEGAVGVSRAIELVTQILQALQDAHGRGIVHRDINPSNVMLVMGPDRRETVRVLDFGIARILEEDAQGKRITRMGLTLGTPTYMAPEQVEQKGIGPATDIYAVGVLLYRLIQGRLPFTGQSAIAIMQQQLQAEPPTADAAPAGLQKVIAKALAKVPEDRYVHAGAMRAAIAPFAGAQSTRIVRKASGEETPVFATAIISSGDDEGRGDTFIPQSPEQRTNWMLFIAVGLLVAASLGALYAVFGGGDDPAPDPAPATAAGEPGEAPPKATAPVPSGPIELSIGWTERRGILRAYPTTDSAAALAIDLTTERLVRIEADGTVRGAAVGKWTAADDGRSVDLTLTEGTVFHPHPCVGDDGRPATARDLAWSVDYGKRMGPGLDRLGIESTEVRPDGSVRVRFARAVPHGVAALAAVRLLPAEIDTCDDPRRFTRPVGSGAFRFASAPHDGRFKLVRAAGGRWAQTPGPPTLYVDRVAPDDAIGALDAGRIDVARVALDSGLFADPGMPALSGAPDGVSLALTVRPDQITQVMMVFLGDGPHSDARVRRAIALAVDRPVLARQLPGLAEPLGRVLEPGMAGHDADKAGLTGDRAQAKALMAEVGDVDPLLLGTTEALQGAASAIADQLRGLGIKVIVNIINADQVESAMQQRQLDAVLVAREGHRIGADPLPYVERLADVVGLAPQAEDPAVGEALRAAARTMDPAKRAALYAQVEDGVLKALPFVPLARIKPDGPRSVLLLGSRAGGLADNAGLGPRDAARALSLYLPGGR